MKEYLKERYVVLITAFWAFASTHNGFDAFIFGFGLLVIVVWFILFGINYKYKLREIRKQRNKAYDE